jgi:hypothetical protein
MLFWGLTLQAVPPPTGVAPVLVPSGGFAIDGDLQANTPAVGAGDWIPGVAGAGGAVLDTNGVPLNPATTFHFVDLYNSAGDTTFKGGLKWTDDPNTWTWTSGSASSKTDITNVLMHITTDANGHSWLVIAADRASTSGDSYIDFEFLQSSLTISNTSLTITNSGTFVSAGLNGGRTLNDLLLSLAFTSGGSVADFFAWRWQTNGPGSYTYVDVTTNLPTGGVFVAASPANTPVPFGAFGGTTYAANQFAEAAVDLTALLGNFDPCLSIGVASIMVKTKTSQSGTASIVDFINPIQYTLRIGPSAYAGPNQTNCMQGASTTFNLQGQATQGLQPIASTTWSVVSGSATIDSTNSLNTTAHVSSSSATLRLTVLQSNGCTEKSDIILTVAPIPACSISGPASVCPSSSSQFSAPAGLASYSWTISGNGSISGLTNLQTVTVVAGATCNADFTLSLNVANNNNCPNSCSSDVMVQNTVAPSITSMPQDVTVQCAGAIPLANDAAIAATSNCGGSVAIAHSDQVINGSCPNNFVIQRTYTATDSCGNTSSQMQTITVNDTTPPAITSIPGDVTVQCAGAAPAANEGAVVATDNCGGTPVISHSDQTIQGTCANNFVIKRTYTATDACGLSSSKTQTITVNDTTPPVITSIPGDVVVECASAAPAANEAAVAATDNCGGTPVITHSDQMITGTCANKFTIKRTYTATDACGLTSSKTQTITVNDDTAPVITSIPGDVTVECASAVPAANDGAVVATDNCGATPAITHSDQTITGTCANKFTIKRTYIATDACGNSSSQTQTITVNDDTAPAITSIPGDVTVECASAVPAANDGAVVATDNCGGAPIISHSDQTITGTCANKFTIKRTYTATDVCGNSSSLTQTITINDDTAPVITSIPGDTTVSCAGSVPTANDGAVVATDNCGGAPVITHSDQTIPGTCANNFVIKRTYTATDACANSSSLTQTITVSDTTPPSITSIPSDVTVECAGAVPAANDAAVVATDGCGGKPVITHSDHSTPGTCGNKFIIQRTYTATDACGNHSSQTQTITVNDDTAPVITSIPADVTVECAASVPAPKDSAVVATDNCGGTPVVTHSDQTTPGTCANKFVLKRTYTATDACGNSSSQTQTITVNDDTAPTITSIPADVTVECAAAVPGANDSAVVATDNCGGTPVITHSDQTTPGTCANKFVLKRTYTATDACGNSSSLTQTITVNDDTAPVITSIPADVTVQCAGAVPAANEGAVAATDNCGGTPGISHSDQTINGTCANKFTIKRTYTATDACGNASSLVQTITVNDTTPPTITSIPADATVECASAVPAANEAAVVATDACGGAPVITHSDQSTPGTCPNKFVLKRTYIATDACGNSSSKTQTITVNDDTPPVITSIPADVTVQCAGAVPAANDAAVVATDNCGGTPVVTHSDQNTSGTCVGKFVIKRTYTATDACGNSSSQVQTITVNDNTAPTITSIPGDLTVQCAGAVPTANDASVVANDTCGGTAVISHSDQTIPGGCANKFVIKRTYTATDACGNSASQVQTITVNDTTPPSITSIPTDVSVQCASDVPAANNAAVVATDACGATPVITHNDLTNSGTCANSFIIKRTYTATDACGNSSNLVQTITVQDTMPPVVTAPANLTIACTDSLNPSVNKTLGTATAVDNCTGASTPTYSDQTVAGNCPGNYTVKRTWSSVDGCGNIGTALQTITVQDIVPPVVTPPANVTIACTDSQDPNVNKALGFATAVDNCSGPSTPTYNDQIVAGSCVANYTIRRTWTSHDGCGNVGTALQTITVRDTTPPILTLPPNLTLECPANTSTNNTGVATAQDSCSPATVTYSDVVSNNCGGAKIISRVWTATDQCGNTSSATQTITVRDTTPPTITAPPNLVLECPADTRTNSTGVAVGQDGCGSVTIQYSDSVVTGCGNTKVITRTWTASDGCGNSASAVQTITVRDTTPPSLVLPQNLVQQCPGNTSTNATGVPMAVDGCGSVTLSYSDVVSNYCGLTKTVWRTWTAVDQCGNSTNGVQTIAVIDTTKPTITCPNLAVQCAGDVPAAYATLAAFQAAGGTATDSCSPGLAFTLSSDSGVVGSCPGKVTRVYRVTDACGNFVDGTQTITVQDTIAPVITCPSNAIAECGTSLDPVNTGLATATDNCDTNVKITYSDSIANSSSYSLKLYAADPNPSSGPYQPTYLKFGPGSLTPPVGGRAQDPLRNAVAYGPTANTLDALTSMGSANLCLGQVVPYEAVINVSGGPGLERGTIDFTAYWNTYTSSNNRFGYDTNYMIYAAFVDCGDPGNYDQNNNARVQSFSSKVVNPGTINEAIQGTFTVSGLDSGDQIVVEIWVVLDSSMPDHTSGNIAAGLVSAQKDSNPPQPITTGTQTTVIGNIGKLTPLPAPQQQPPLPPPPPPAPSTGPGCLITALSRTWTATDTCGNSSSCVQQIEVRETKPPAMVIPPDMVLECPADTSTNNTGTATAQDACGNFTLSYSDTVTNGCGNTKVVSRLWTAVDDCGNTTNRVQTITVRDTKPPVVSAPVNITIACTDSLNPSVNAALGVATATDGCSGASIPTYSDQIIPGNCAGNFTVKRSWSSHDGCGNVGTALQTITVQDTTPPTITAPPNLVLSFTADIRTNSTGVASASDSCSGVTLTYHDVMKVQTDGSQLITRTWSATDGCGNSASAVQTITLDSPSALILPVQPNIVLTDLTTLTVTNTATNPNVPANPITYQLINPPAGASINGNGIITWTPTLGQSPSTNVITTVVTTTVTSAAGSSTLRSTNSFLVTITTPYDGLDMSLDTDGDGLTNLVEFAVGSNPNNSADANSRIIIWITQDNSGNHYLAMKFARRTNAAALGLQYLPEVSADKITWASDSANVLSLGVQPLDTEYDWVTVRDQTPITPSMARFVRLHIVTSSLESFSPTWIGSDTLITGTTTGLSSRTTFFSQRMVLPVMYAGTVSSLQNTALTDTNANWTTSEFGSGGVPAYAEFDNGSMVDIASSASTSKSLSLAGSLAGMASSGDAYRIRAHFTVASLFGTNNETGLKSGGNTAQADNIMVLIPQTQQTLTIFYYDDGVNHGWLTADYTPADKLVIYPEQGLLVRRVVSGDRNLYLCGPVKTGVTMAPVQPGYNLVGTLKSLSPLNLSGLNLYTGNPVTGLASGGNTADSDTLLVVQPDGTTATYFYYKDSFGNEGWLDANYNFSAAVPIKAGSAFFIHRLPANSGFNWTIPAE